MAPVARRRRPDGLVLQGKKKGKTFRLGKCLGEGAQGAVYAIIDESNGAELSNFVAKVATKPANYSNKKKKNPSEEEINYNLLYQEKTHYFSRLESLRGKVIPRIPLDVKGSDIEMFYDDVDGA